MEYAYMSRREVYDNWGKLVEATLKRELLRELAYCSSLSSSSSIGSSSVDSSLRFNDSPPPYVNELYPSSSSQGGVVGSISSTGTIHARRFTARLLAAPAIALARYIRRKPTRKHIFDIPSEVDLGHFKRFPLRELQVASDNFSTKNIIRRDGFCRVYKGRLADGSLVAVKRLKEKPTPEGEIQFQKSIEIASMIVHPNLISLLGICTTSTERILVYPYMSNGNVASILRERPESQPPLAWSKRKSIAVGSARGLAYLHDQCDIKIIHRDVKASHIFLDEDFEAVIGDFGLAIFMDHSDTHATTDVCGTIGHIAPEYLATGVCSEKTDVYGYGVMLLELITGQRAFDLARLANDDDVMLLDWVNGFHKEKKLEILVDVDLRGNYIIEEVEQLIQIILLCTKDSPTERPKMSEVVRMLEEMFKGVVIGSSSSSTGPIIPSSRVELDASSSSSSQGVLVGSNSSTGAIDAGRFAARVLAAPAMALAHFFDDPSEIELRHLKIFSLHELRVASDNFSKQNIISRGGFGKVYKGRLADGSLVAVKRLKERPIQGEKFEFQISIVIASMSQHPNLLRLLGICITPTEIMLVYPYMSNGSLASILRGRSESRPLLDWSKRKLIAVGSARGLAYLHDQCGLKIIHRNVKAATILLDEDFEAVVGDFGLAKFMYHKDTHDAITLCGIFGHIAPEYYSSTSNFSERMDVYGYGVMLLELITGRRALDLTRLANDAMIFDWVKRLFMEKKLETLVDSELQGNYMVEDVEQLIQVALLCTQHSPSELPKMSEVVRMLEGDDDLAGKWEESQKENRLMQHNTDQIISNSVSNSYNTGYMSDSEEEEYSKPR